MPLTKKVPNYSEYYTKRTNILYSKVQFRNVETCSTYSTHILNGLNIFGHRGNEITQWTDYVLSFFVTCAFHEIGVLFGTTIESSGMS